MQTILVPINFSAACENALIYANKLAVRLPADVVLVHAGTGSGLTAEQRATLLRRLETLAERLRYQQLTRQDGRRISYHFHLAAEPLAECLEVLVGGYQASLVVTGLTLLDCAMATAAGAPVSLLPERVSCPVLIVPPGRHELPGRLVVSGDFSRLDGRQLAPLTELGRTPAMQVDLVQFYQELPEASAASKLVVKLQALLQAAQQYLPNAAIHLLPDDDALEGLSEFGARQQAQLLVLATTDGCLVRRFFNPHYRRTHAYHLRVPTLLLPTSTLPTTACCESCALRQAAETQLMARLSTVAF